jgi:hypothetical protein
MITKTLERGRLRAFSVGLVVALSSFVGSYRLFLWGFIKFWEWQHDGRPMKFIFWPEYRALPLALLVTVAATFFVVRYVRQGEDSN